jgi:hypothetical protein
MYQYTDVPQNKQLDNVRRASEIPSGALKTNSDAMKESMNHLEMKIDSSFMQLNAKLDILQAAIEEMITFKDYHTQNISPDAISLIDGLSGAEKGNDSEVNAKEKHPEMEFLTTTKDDQNDTI